MWSRIHLTALLQAEEDHDQVRRHFADQAREKELLGSQSSIMSSDRYVMLQIGFEKFEYWGEGGWRRGGELVDVC